LCPYIHVIPSHRHFGRRKIRYSPVFSRTDYLSLHINAGKPGTVSYYHINPYFFCRTGNPFPDRILFFQIKGLSFREPGRRLLLPFYQHVADSLCCHPKCRLLFQPAGRMENHMMAAVRYMPVGRPEKAPLLPVKILAHAVINLKISGIPYPVRHIFPFHSCAAALQPAFSFRNAAFSYPPHNRLYFYLQLLYNKPWELLNVRFPFPAPILRPKPSCFLTHISQENR